MTSSCGIQLQDITCQVSYRVSNFQSTRQMCGSHLAARQSLQVRELIYRELLEYHPHMLADYLSGNRQQPSFMYPSAVDNFKRQFAHLEGGGAYGAGMGGRNNLGQATSLPRERVKEFQNEAQRYAPGQQIPAQPSRAVDSLGSGVRNMTVLEQQQNGYSRMQAEALGRPPMSQQQQLLRSNSFQ